MFLSLWKKLLQNYNALCYCISHKSISYIPPMCVHACTCTYTHMWAHTCTCTRHPPTHMEERMHTHNTLYIINYLKVLQIIFLHHLRQVVNLHWCLVVIIVLRANIVAQSLTVDWLSNAPCVSINNTAIYSKNTQSNSKNMLIIWCTSRPLPQEKDEWQWKVCSTLIFH